MLNKLTKKTLISVFFVFATLISPSAYSLPTSCPNLSQLDKSTIESAIVDWVPDGDTIHTLNGKKLRLLHINAPELNPTNKKPAEAFANAAKKHLQKLIGSSKKIYWINDVKQKDKYGRELALIFNDQGSLINAQMVFDGFAHILVIPPNQNYWQCIADSESEARNKNKAIWTNRRYQAKSVAEIKPHQGFQLVTGKITEISNSKKNRWLVLDNQLWVGIPKKNFVNFEKHLLDFKVGQFISVRSFAYTSHGKLRMKLNHPAMLYKK